MILILINCYLKFKNIYILLYLKIFTSILFGIFKKILITEEMY